MIDKLIFLQNTTLFENPDFAIGAGIIGLILGFLALYFVFMIGIYVYTSFAFFSVGKKAKLKFPGLAWIPGVGPLIIAYQSSKMHWWPWLLIVGFLIPIINIIAMLVFGVYSIIWLWKMFERIKQPGWFAILMIIPIVNLVIIGVAAWSKK